MHETVQAVVPPHARVEGPSFSTAMKVMATGLMAALVYWAWDTLNSGAWSQWSSSARIFMGFVLLTITSGYWGILTSRTSLDGKAIRQSWLWPKEVQLSDVTQVKLIDVRGFGWLIAPRLVVRAGGISLTTFHVADPRVLAAFRRLAYG